jgi:BatD DUF11 like domain
MSSAVETSREFRRGLCYRISDVACPERSRRAWNDACEMHIRMSPFKRILIAVLVVIATAQFAHADTPSVTAVLNSSEAVLGETVQLEIRITGARGAEAPEDILVDGLEIHRTGSSQRIEMNNFKLTSSTIYDYTVLPTKAGTFTIPPQTIRVGNNSLRTPALTLNVADSSGRSFGNQPGRSFGNQPGRDTRSAGANQLAFAELVVPKKTAYVGEVIPIVIRLGFFVRGQVVQTPVINTAGLTMQKLQMPERPRIENINGRQCEVYTFKTAVSATRQGKFEIGPVQADTVVVVPRQRQRNPRRSWPPDLSDMDDFFNDPFFSDPFERFGKQEKLVVKSEPVALEVKPLPPNAPPSFSGAIGNFAMATDAKPKSIQVGDPITVTTTISGRGNFDRVNAPLIEDERGWHKYPPSSKFKEDDEVGISGTKTFEMVLSPNEKKQTLPLLGFSYFDPVKEQYVTLHSETIPINVQGTAAVAQTAGPAQPAASTPATAAAQTPPQPVSKPQDILYQLTELPKKSKSFAPAYTRPTFWAAQLIPLLALLGFAGWKIRRARIDNREAQRISALQHEATDLMHKLHRNDVSPREYYAEASRVVRVKAALASGNRRIDPNMVDAETAAETFKLNSDSRDRLRRLFEQSDEWQYSGAHNGPGNVSPENRRDVLELIENLRT